MHRHQPDGSSRTPTPHDPRVSRDQAIVILEDHGSVHTTEHQIGVEEVRLQIDMVGATLNLDPVGFSSDWRRCVVRLQDLRFDDIVPNHPGFVRTNCVQTHPQKQDSPS